MQLSYGSTKNRSQNTGGLRESKVQGPRSNVHLLDVYSSPNGGLWTLDLGLWTFPWLTIDT